MDSDSLAGRLILICEDEPLIALDIANAFTNEGARVVTARSLRDALVAVENSGLSAAILDHALKRWRQFAALRTAQSAQRTVRALQRV